MRAKSGLISPHKVIARMFSDLDDYDVVSGAYGGNGSTEGASLSQRPQRAPCPHTGIRLLSIVAPTYFLCIQNQQRFAHLSQRTEGNHFGILKPVFTTASLQQDKVFILFVVSIMVVFILLEARAYQYTLAWP